LGCSIVVTIVVMIGGGILLDRVWDTSPVLTLAGVGLGLAAAIYQLYELAQIGKAPEKAPPLTRGLAHLPIGRKPTGSTDEMKQVEHGDGPREQRGPGHG
jgi:hypothetical protein